ncbi:ABC transporter permease [Spirillospora sp. NPDC047279]|uniref:ABC transporter permease n=1 Tax=Spirillospora sp. NPDC047279 TaxID=3155478 RepID=UPI003405CB4F
MKQLTGTGGLARLALRRDRVMLPIWTALFVLTASSTASSTKGLYPTVEDRVELASSTNDTPSLVALYGKVYDPTSLGAVSMLKMNVFGSLMAAILTVIIVVRHTRQEEETGRLELLGATVVGRRAPLTAALVVAGLANLAIGLLAALGLVAAGLPVAGSFASGLAWASVGIAFGAVAAVIAQLTESARTAVGFSMAALGAFYLIRAVGDTSDANGPQWLSWLSPIGWGQQFRPYAGDRWWVAGLTVVFAAVMIGLAYGLVARRDLGAGLLPDRPGPATAGRRLGSPFGLAWRLQRGSVIGWTIGGFAGGLLFGSIATNVDDMVSGGNAKDFIEKLGGNAQNLTDAFLATELGFVGVFVAAFGVQSAMRLRTEETAQRAEPVLATAVGRVSWALSHLVIALAGAALILAVVGFGAGLSYGGATSDMGEVGRLTGAALVQIPAVWVIVAIVIAAFGLVPRFAVAGWAALVAFLLLGELGPLFELPGWLMDVSPFAHTPRMPGGDLTAAPIAGLLAVAAVLIAAGLYGFRRRDLTA